MYKYVLFFAEYSKCFSNFSRNKNNVKYFADDKL